MTIAWSFLSCIECVRIAHDKREALMSSVLSESTLRRLAREHGYALRKSRAGESADQRGEFMLIDADNNAVVLGERFDATLADISEFLAEAEAELKEYEASPNAPAIICIDESRGYVPGNIEVVSNRAAMMLERLRELRATPDELRRMADWIEEINASVGLERAEVGDAREVKILNAGAPICDTAALERLLLNLPNADALRPLLGTEFALRFYDDKARREIWVSSDGEHVILNAVENIGSEESRCIHEFCDTLLGRPQAIVRLVCAALNLKLDRSVEPTIELREGITF